MDDGGAECHNATSSGRTRFRLRRASYKGAGLQPELTNASWELMLDLCYEESELPLEQ